MATELAEIFRNYGPGYRQKYGERIPSHHLKAMRAIETCRTEALGGQVYTCLECQQVQYSYHSCRNRHCPKCQNENGQIWLEKQQEMLLPVPYFMLTFTLPSGLRDLARHHQRKVYDLFFRLSSETIQQVAKDPRFLGGQAGFMGVLHTWGRNLSYHPHIHYLVPAGGLAADGHTWLPARYKFLLPVKVLSKIFRAKMRDALQNAEPDWSIPHQVWYQEWVIHCKPVGAGYHALKYLAPYIFRVAIGNKRILSCENDQVTFRYKASDTGQERLCTLNSEEFIHRFLQHVLPMGFVKVRYFGFLRLPSRKLLAKIKSQLPPLSPCDSSPQKTIIPTKPAYTCPICGCSLVLTNVIYAKRSQSPP